MCEFDPVLDYEYEQEEEETLAPEIEEKISTSKKEIVTPKHEVVDSANVASDDEFKKDDEEEVQVIIEVNNKNKVSSVVNEADRIKSNAECLSSSNVVHLLNSSQLASPKFQTEIDDEKKSKIADEFNSVLNGEPVEKIEERIYSREDLEKVKAFFRMNKKRKDKDHSESPSISKKFKENEESIGETTEYMWSNDLKPREKRLVDNYIPYPRARVSSSEFEADIRKAFTAELKDDVLQSFKATSCGLCFKDFEDNASAWKHYIGASHKNIINRFNTGSYRGHPPYWRMIYERLSYKSVSFEDLLKEVRAIYNVDNDKERVRQLLQKNLDHLMDNRVIGRSGHLLYVRNNEINEVKDMFESYRLHNKNQKDPDRNRKSSNYKDEISERRVELNRSSRRSHSEYYSNRNSSSSRDPLKASPSKDFNNEMNSRGSSMLVIDPSKLRMLPNGKVMIKSDDVKSISSSTRT